MYQKRIWISWETQRRSIELSNKLNCKLFIIELHGLLRYPLSILKTILILLKENPSIFFVQNPSMVLALIACFYGKLVKIPLIIDRHTTFLLDKYTIQHWNRRVFLFLSRYTIRNALITIVTNEGLIDLVKQSQGNPFVLPDPLPDISPIKKKSFSTFSRMNLLVPSSFGFDEPVFAILNASKSLSNNGIFFYITGDDRRFQKKFKLKIPDNVQLTGFLPLQDYVDLLFSVDGVMVLTTASFCMLCGCYEAITAEKPLITSDKPALKNYFYDALFVDNSAENIARACIEMLNNIDLYKEKSKKMKATISKQWDLKLLDLEESLLHLKKN